MKKVGNVILKGLGFIGVFALILVDLVINWWWTVLLIAAVYWMFTGVNFIDLIFN